jgi:hypothetical protein
LYILETNWIYEGQFAGIIGFGCLVRALINSCVITGKTLLSITVEIYIYDIAVNILFIEIHFIAVMYIAQFRDMIQNLQEHWF